MQTLVINRAVDRRRLAFMERSVRAVPALDFRRVDAVDGHAPGFDMNDHLPGGVPPGFKTPTAPGELGRVGCFLSHARAWETIVSEGHEMALILEDDVWIDPGEAGILNQIRSLGAFDFIFVNRRMVKHRQLLAEADTFGFFAPLDKVYRAFPSVLSKSDFDVVVYGGKLPRAPGGDAYVLSRAGARALLDTFARSRMITHVDRWLLAASLGIATVEQMPYGPRRYAELARKLGRDAPLAAYVAQRPLGMQKSGAVGGSIRKTGVPGVGRRVFGDWLAAVRRLGRGKA